MSLREHLSQKLPVYLLVVVLGGLMSYYYFVFVPQNEQRLVAHANRLLDNKVKSVIEKYRSYSDAIATAPKAYFLKWYFAVNPNDTEGYVQEKESTFLFSSSKSDNDFISITKQTFDKALVDDKLQPDRINSALVRRTDSLLYQEKSGNYHFVYQPAGKFIKQENLQTVHPYLLLQVTDFMTNLKSNDFFDDLFLVSNDTRESKADKYGSEASVLDSSRLGLVRFYIPDSLKNFGTGSFSKTLSGQHFRVYIKQLKLNRDLQVCLVGMVAESKLHQQAREVPAWFVVFCLLAGLLLIFLFPVIKIFTINRHERLSATDARLSIFSMILFLSLATILLVGSYIFLALNNERMDKELQQLSATISSATTNHIDSLQTALNDSQLFSNDSPKKNLNQFRAKYPTIKKFNEVFSLRLEKNNEGEAGSTKDLFTSGGVNDFALTIFPVQVSSRDYFRSVKTAKDNTQTIDYSLQSINSFTSGRGEAAVSILWGDREVRVITSRLPSVIRAILPAPYKFVVVNKAGDIKFHSERTELQSENFVSECNDDQALATFLTNNVQGAIDFTYLRNDCRGYIRPLVKDWQLIVYYEQRESRSLAAEIFSLCLISLALVIVCNGLIHFSFMWDRRRSGLLKTKTFFYHWLNPLIAGTNHWLYLFVFGLLLLATEIVWLIFFQSITASILLVFLMITLFYTVSYAYLNPKRINPGLSRSMKWLIGLLSLWLISFIIISDKTGKDAHICFMVIALLFILILMAVLRVINKNVDWGKKISQYFAYRLFISTALLVIAVGPAWIFISEHYYYSSLAHQYAQTFQDIKKVQIKSVNDQRVWKGMDYTIEKESTSSCSFTLLDYKNPDLAFYRFLQNFQVTTPSMVGFKFDLLPNHSGYTLYTSSAQQKPERLKVKAPESLIKEQSNAIVREQVINRLEWNSDSPVVVFLFLFVVVFFFIFWWVIRELPRKIFFAPDRIVWDCFPKRTLSKFLEKEFENSEDKKHPLHYFPLAEKNKLIDNYEEEIKQANSKSIELLIRDRYILKLQDAAEILYIQAWSNCTEEEKYLIYDLSVDGIINQADPILIGRVAEKKLIRLIPRVEPVNLSFANFVLNSMNEKELATWRAKEDREGNWGNLRLILIIIVTTAFVFLSVAEEGFAGKVTALLASVGLIFPRLITLIASVGDLVKTKTGTA